jgi:hypothetical protein
MRRRLLILLLTLTALGGFASEMRWSGQCHRCPHQSWDSDTP